MLDASIRLGDLGIFLLGTALLVLIIYGILILKNFLDTLKIVRKMIQDNEENLKKVLDKAPAIAENIESISGDISHDVKALQGTIEHLVGTTEAAAGALAENTDILSSVLGVVQVVMVIKDFFASFSKKKKWL